MTDVLIVGDTHRSAELRHEIPVDIGDTFLYAEVGDRRVSIVWSIEGDRIAAVDPSIEIVHSETFPIDDLLREGVDFYEIGAANIVRQVQSLGLRSARVPGEFPLRFADALRAAGVELVVDQRLFDDRRRRKTPLELEGIHRASRAAEAGTAAIAALLARSEPGDGGRVLDGEPLTCEALREAAIAVFGAAGCRGDDLIVGRGHAVGRRPRRRIGPDRQRRRDRLRPVPPGPRERLLRRHDAHVHGGDARLGDRDVARPDAGGARALPRPRPAGRRRCRALACGLQLLRGARPSRPGSRSRRAPSCARASTTGSATASASTSTRRRCSRKAGHELVAGDVITLEPGLYRHGFGGVRLEDTIVVTDDGCETITDFPYGLDPAAAVVETAR